MFIRLIIICFLLAAPMLHAESNATKSTANCSLTVGWSIWPPYQYLSTSGKPTGLQIDLLKQIASTANCKFNFVLQPFSQNISDIKTGKIDMMPDITVTDERRSFAYFSETYRHEIQILYVKQNLSEQCDNPDIEKILINNFRLGLAEKNYYGKKVEEIKHNVKYKNNIVFIEQNNQGLDAIMSGKIDGYFEDPAVMAYLSESNKLKIEIDSCHVENYAGEVSLMFSKKSTDALVVERINRAIRKVKQSSQYKKRWEW